MNASSRVRFSAADAGRCDTCAPALADLLEGKNENSPVLPHSRVFIASPVIPVFGACEKKFLLSGQKRLMPTRLQFHAGMF
jgi:hypothetical protein